MYHHLEEIPKSQKEVHDKKVRNELNRTILVQMRRKYEEWHAFEPNPKRIPVFSIIFEKFDVSKQSIITRLEFSKDVKWVYSNDGYWEFLETLPPSKDVVTKIT